MPSLSGKEWLFARVLWVIGGVGFTSYRIVGSGPDGIALAGLAFTFAILLLPLIKELELPGGTKLKLQDKELAVKSNLLTAGLQDDLALLLVSYTSTIATADVVLSRSSVGSVATRVSYAKFVCADIIASSLKWFAVTESLRILVYQYDEGPRVEPALVYVLGNVVSDEASVLSREYFTVDDNDPVGTAWREQRAYNLENLDDDSRPRVLPALGIRYNGIMLIPIRRDAESWGMLIVERANAERFGVVAERVGTALANVVGAVLGHPALRLTAVRATRLARRPSLLALRLAAGKRGRRKKS
jgi:GAF domain-containing protein